MRNKFVKKIYAQNLLKSKHKLRPQDLPFLKEFKEKLQNVMDNQY